MRRRGDARERSVGRRIRGRAGLWGLPVRKRTARLAESSSREDPASRRLQGETRRPNKNRRPQTTCLLPLAPVSSRRSLSLEPLASENTPLAQRLYRFTSLLARTPSAGALYPPAPRSVTPIGTVECAFPFWACNHKRFPFPEPAARVVFTGYFGVSAWFLSDCACGTLRARARFFADWVE